MRSAMSDCFKLEGMFKPIAANFNYLIKELNEAHCLWDLFPKPQSSAKSVLVIIDFSSCESTSPRQLVHTVGVIINNVSSRLCISPDNVSWWQQKNHS